MLLRDFWVLDYNWSQFDRFLEAMRLMEQVDSSMIKWDVVAEMMGDADATARFLGVG